MPRRISFIFQGGFVGIKCSIDVCATLKVGDSSGWNNLTRIYPEDVNRRQSFDLNPGQNVQELVEKGVESVKLVFEESSDFFGRVTVYDLELEGQVIRS